MNKVKEYPKLGLVILSYLAFIALGMPDGLLGIAWPSMKTSFSVPLDAVGILLTAMISGYLTSSSLSGQIITRSSVGIVLAASCALTGVSLIGFTLAPAWWIMIFISVMVGLGAGAIDAGLNTYVAAHFNEGMMQWLHACYGIGITTGPIIMTISLTSYNTWRLGYCIVGVFQLALALSFALSLSLWNENEQSKIDKEVKKSVDYKTPLSDSLRQPKVWLSAFLFFLYVGSEASLGTWAYTLLIESRNIQRETAAFWVGSYWATFTIGRILAGLYIKHIGSNILVLISLIAAMIGSVLLWWNPINIISLIAVSFIGFAIAPIFPAMMSGTSQRVGKRYTANTIGMQMSLGSLGAAGIPSLIGILARQISLEVIPICLMILFVMSFGLYLLAVKSGVKA